MSNLDNIIDKIKKDASKEAEQFLQHAQENERLTLEAAEERAKERIEAYEARATENSKLVRERVLSGSTQTARDEVLMEKQSLIDRVAQLSKQALVDMPDEQFVGLVKSYLDKHPMHEGSELILPENRKAVGQKLSKGTVTYNEKLASGFQILQDGIKLNFDFEEIVETLKEEKAPEIVKWSLGEKEAK